MKLLIMLGLSLLAARASGGVKKGFVGDIEKQTEGNTDFRRVLYTGRGLQLVVMSLRPGEEIGKEAHPKTDQFFRVESGTGEIWINGARSALKAGTAALVPAGSEHNVKNTGDKNLTLYTLYAPPQHEDGTVHATKAAAEKAKESFSGKTTEQRLTHDWLTNVASFQTRGHKMDSWSSKRSSSSRTATRIWP